MSKKKRRKELFVTLSPIQIEVISFNGSGSRIRDDEGHAWGNGCRYIEGSWSKSGIDWYSLDNEGAVM
jgi:hypothetical protein